MGTGKHRAPNPQRQKVGSMVAAGAVPLVLALVGTGTANAEPAQSNTVSQREQAKQLPAADASDVVPYEGLIIPDDTHSSLQWARPAPEQSYLAPVGVLHPPIPVEPVPPIAPPPGQFRFGDVTVATPDWIDHEQAIQINDAAAVTEANLATFLDSVGMERSRSDRIAAQTVGTAAMGAVAGVSSSVPIAVTSGMVGAAAGLVAGLPFAPIGLLVGPALGAAIGTAAITVPAAIVGAAAGAAVGAAGGFIAPARVLGD
ncbi:hypothetical protein [Nocardia xishanensis]|uniref:hypothetical protein n=1 Tax=Nocardia xishanensis TaxID=238964 RepID=UPI000836CD15|nr:hypothetical protein [Nocardia xishanensis]